MIVVQFFTGRHEVKLRRLWSPHEPFRLLPRRPGNSFLLQTLQLSPGPVFLSRLDFRIAKAEAFLRVKHRWLEALASTANYHHPLSEPLPSLQRGAVACPFLTRVRTAGCFLLALALLTWAAASNCP